jgi:dTDP-4-dehydrorhamnose 3,5-epimerase
MMEFLKFSVAGLLLFTPKPHRDNRGYCSRTFDAEIARQHGVDPSAFVQDSVSRSALA